MPLFNLCNFAPQCGGGAARDPDFNKLVAYVGVALEINKSSAVGSPAVSVFKSVVYVFHKNFKNIADVFFCFLRALSCFEAPKGV